MTIYRFARLINKYCRPTTLHIAGTTTWVNGKPVTTPADTQTIQLAVIPFDVREIAQLGGMVSSGDASVYSLIALKHGDRIEQNGYKYTIDTSANFKPFGDFHRYIAKGVSSFD